MWGVCASAKGTRRLRGIGPCARRACPPAHLLPPHCLPLPPRNVVFAARLPTCPPAHLLPLPFLPLLPQNVVFGDVDGDGQLEAVFATMRWAMSAA